MLLLNDLRNVQEMKAPSSLDHNYKWLLFPYQDTDLMIMLIHEPERPQWQVTSNFGYGYLNVWENTPLEPIESISLSRAAGLYSEMMEEQNEEITPNGFANWVIANLSIRVKHRLFDVDIEEDSDYPFLKHFSKRDYEDQGLHALANTLSGYFHTLFSQSKAH